MKTYSGTSANSVWRRVATDLLNKQGASSVDSRCGATTEILHGVLRIKDPRQRWVLARVPEMNPAFALAEVVWIMTGRDDTAFLEHWFPGYAAYVGGKGRQYGAYGARLRKHHGIDQITRAYDALRSRPEGRQVVLQIWSAADDLPDSAGQPRSGDIPCNISSCLKIRDGRLHWLQIVRSNDIDRGLPHNLVQFTMLQEVFAGWLGLRVGEYVHVADSLHLYSAQPRRLDVDTNVVSCRNSDCFEHGFAESLSSFQALARRMDRLIRSHNKGHVIPLRYKRELPPQFENIFAVVAADDARRYGNRTLAQEYISTCSNPLYLQLWDRWNRRLSRTLQAV